jgi:hypothetical protein
MTMNFISPTKTASVEVQRNGLYLGIVTRVDGTKVYVEIPQLTPGFSYGPCPVLSNNLLLTYQAAVSSTSTTTSSAVISVSGGNGTPVSTQSAQFVNGVTDNTDDYLTNVQMVVPPVGTSVLCGFLNNSLDEIVILGSVLS